MKKLLPLLMLLSLMSAQTYETYGDPRDLSFPGGYIGLSVNYGTNKTIGFQASVAMIIPYSEPGTFPFIFPGIVLGRRYSFVKKNSYNYRDVQLLFLTPRAFWAGAGYGVVFINGEKKKRMKYFGGFLLGGYTKEYILNPERESFFNGFHLGLGLPLIGNSFYP